jgi:hypothetical protein
MTLVKLKETYPNYQEFDQNEEKVSFESFEVYNGVGDRIGTLKDILVDEEAGKFRYLIVDTGFWIFGKQVLIPIGLVRFDNAARRVYIDGLKKRQIEGLPEFKDDKKIDQDYEELVRKEFRPMVIWRGDQSSNTLYDRNTYTYEQDAALYTLVGQENEWLHGYEQQLAARSHQLQ